MDTTKQSNGTDRDRQSIPKDAAVRHMTRNVPTAKLSQTIADLQTMLHGEAHKRDSINFIYVLDDQEKLIGLLSIKDLFRHPANALVSSICKREHLITIRETADQERAAYLALRHNIKAVPVVDKENRFLGAIPSDTILSILYREMHEDILRLSGVHHRQKDIFDNVLTLSLWKALKHRIPWLLIGLLGGMFSAKIIGFFEGTLEKNLILASFIPLIVYMSDAVGTQMEAFVIRDLAMNHHLPFGRYLFRHFLVTFVMAGVFSTLLFIAVIATISNSVSIAAVLSMSLFLAVISSVFTGLIIPHAFSRCKMDPANASGPIATIIQDLSSVVIYFSIAWMLL